ncbi:DUF2283 domain-containing protein [Sphaerisporangium perillae]|uniref:DUF2283 domain-containing protein n=1 Tax=Sphaerisporangium perillae TaxID=2935860 RepID=UPI00200DDF99|nr:DUF2283 domain-containing protein [Sphaerisporangium perillae]
MELKTQPIGGKNSERLSDEIEYDHEVDAAYSYIVDAIADGEAVEQVVVERPGSGDIVLDFDRDGHLLGVEIIGANRLLR